MPPVGETSTPSRVGASAGEGREDGDTAGEAGAEDDATDAAGDGEPPAIFGTREVNGQISNADKAAVLRPSSAMTTSTGITGERACDFPAPSTVGFCERGSGRCERFSGCA